MKIIPIIGLDTASSTLNKVAMHEREMLKHIGGSMNAMRLIKLIPDFAIFKETEAWWMASKNWSPRAKSKYQAWWEAIRCLQRDAKDSKTVSLLISFCLQETVVRSYGKELPLNLSKIGETDEKHIERVKAYVKERYTALDPEFSLAQN